MIIYPGTRVINAANPESSFGTVGGPVKLNNEIYVITCFHCVYKQDMLWSDDSPKVHTKVKFLTSSGYEEGGHIKYTCRTKFIDIALIKLVNGFTSSNEIPNFGKLNSFRKIADLKINASPVRKYGGTTADTFGVFMGIETSIGMPMQPDNMWHYFQNLLFVRSSESKPFSAAGDSGSFVLDNLNNLIGLIVMSLGEFTYIISAEQILGKYFLTLMQP